MEKKQVESMNDVAAIVMAAGQGTRMKSSLPKVLHPVGGRPMVWYMASLARRVSDSSVVMVIGHGAEKVREFLDHEKAALEPYAIVEQPEQRGTGHAVQQARNVLFESGKCIVKRCLILNGDTPLLTEQTVSALLDQHQAEKATVTMLTTNLDDPQGYGRVVRAQNGQVCQIVEDRDASRQQRKIQEVNVGTYVVQGDFLFHALEMVEPANVQGEYYLTDIIEIAVKQGLPVSAMMTSDSVETVGINTREHLAFAEKHMRQRICQRWMHAGVTMLDPNRIIIDDRVEIGQDSVLHPNVVLEGETRLGESCLIRSHTRITNSTLGQHVVVQDCCVVNESLLEDHVVIGPFAHLRPGTKLCHRAKVGNFVELKQTKLGEGSKANHLTYLGDTIVGREVNIGAGTITCNYDGFKKEQTIIEDQVFIGSDAQLIAPVKVGHGAIIGAGTTVTQDVPPGALGISRTMQVNKEGVAARRRAIYTTSKAGQKNQKKSQPGSKNQGKKLRK